MTLDDDARYRAVQARDARFDGWFVTAVTSTGIYCRPSCPALTPKRANVRFYSTAAGAQAAGFRACRRCRPDATPGAPEWRARADLVGRAMRLIADGVVDRAGVAGLARQLGYSERQLHRQLVAELGVGPVALARAQRAQTARLLLETTGLAAADIAFAAGFTSVRQFNDTIREVFAATPTQLRRAGRGAAQSSSPGTVVVRLPYREPMDLAGLMDFLAARAVPAVEEHGEHFRRSVRLAHGDGVLELAPGPGHVRCSLHLADLRDLTAAVHRCRRLLDLDADPVAVEAALRSDPLLAPLVRRRPGRRVPGHVDGAELAVRAVIGQQVSVAAARTVAASLVTRWGKPLTSPIGGVTHLFPTADALASADPTDLSMPRARGRALVTIAAAVADGRVDLEPGADRGEVERALLALPGVGPWTASYVAMRALGDPDVFLPTDQGVRHALAQLGQPDRPSAVAAIAQRWRPWRSYAVQHLWSTL
jgi:AraC family transcriptional regulator of adaptative response / DNA-3-methyladenine glycosylase II